jgi:hypothetical protein
VTRTEGVRVFLKGKYKICLSFHSGKHALGAIGERIMRHSLFKEALFGSSQSCMKYIQRWLKNSLIKIPLRYAGALH